ncbi:hypothetical protein N7462_004765 [Penicillium macrosclerotiorum]|uniref:uncharacterized protein n=1 Tax=Penicillium macrosclerotiorum TaxID=303699 RepID=UPI002548D27D|nr:uncharacterized protein N7462_004765 [Penicillium macrosclerotiorum]KAJ5690373.1 hypothetical protein N7462_004765 [Penicillium macrosclerotiorum]
MVLRCGLADRSSIAGPGTAQSKSTGHASCMTRAVGGGPRKREGPKNAHQPPAERRSWKILRSKSSSTDAGASPSPGASSGPSGERKSAMQRPRFKASGTGPVETPPFGSWACDLMGDIDLANLTLNYSAPDCLTTPNYCGAKSAAYSPRSSLSFPLSRTSA